MRLLKKAYALFEDRYYLEYRAENILEISESKDHIPFAYIVLEHNNPIEYLVSFNIEFTNVNQASELVLLLRDYSEVKVAEEFFIDDNQVFWGEEAIKHYNAAITPEYKKKNNKELH